MSKTTWMREFYRVAASTAAKGSDVAAVEHSLAKWIGLRDSNLAKHKVSRRPPITIDSTSCALCAKYLDNDDQPYGVDPCSGCPLFESLGGKSCTDDDMPFNVYCNTKNPEPLIAALEAALAYAKNKEAK